jgi:ribose transport system substrate-binding protein
MRMQRGMVALLLAVAAVGCGGGTGDGPATVGKDLKATGGGVHLGVIPKGTTHEFWKSIHAGAIKAQREFEAQGVPVRLTWKGPIREDDREQQIQVVEGFLSQGVNGLVLAPLDASALVRPVQEAKQAGIPTVVIDSALASQDAVSFVATDNEKGGGLAADRLGALLGGKGRVLVLRYQEGSASTEAREKGFLDRLKSQYPGVQVVSADQYAGPTRDTAKRASENLLNRFGGQVEGIFTPNESSTAGMLLALQDVGKAGQVKFVGFDSSEAFVTAMRNKQLDGVVLQNPFEMGYRGVKTMVAHLRGESIEARVDTGVTIVTPDNLDSAEAKALLNPPLGEFLP